MQKFEKPRKNEGGSEKGAISRRDFLKKAGLLLGAAALGKTGMEAVEFLSREEPEGQIFFEARENFETLVSPEYAKHAEEVLFVFPPESEGFPERDFFLASHNDLFRQFPQYTRIRIVAEKEIAKAKLDALDDGSGRVTIDEIPQDLQSGPLAWTQDILESKNGADGKRIAIIPLRKDSLKKISSEEESEYFQNTPSSWGLDTDRTIESLATAKKIFGEENVEQADFYFEGGNVTFDVVGNVPTVFIGYDDIEQTIHTFEQQSITKTAKDVCENISETFGGARVVVMGKEKQSSLMFHLDQSFVILEGQQVIMTQASQGKTEWDKKIQQQQSFFKAQLESLGYSISEIPHSEDDIRSRKFSVNAIPFIDKATGERKIIFPVYPGEFMEVEEGSEKPLTKESLRGKARAAYRAYEKAGYIPLPVKDESAYKRLGSLHCMSYVVS